MLVGLPYLYRVIPRADARAIDFYSAAVRHIHAILAGRSPTPIPDTGELIHMWAGVSTYATEDRARAVVGYRRWAWAAAIARIRVHEELVANGALWVEKTGADPQHYTVWGDPETLRSCIELSISL